MLILEKAPNSRSKYIYSKLAGEAGGTHNSCKDQPKIVKAVTKTYSCLGVDKANSAKRDDDGADENCGEGFRGTEETSSVETTCKVPHQLLSNMISI